MTVPKKSMLDHLKSPRMMDGACDKPGLPSELTVTRKSSLTSLPWARRSSAHSLATSLWNKACRKNSKDSIRSEETGGIPAQLTDSYLNQAMEKISGSLQPWGSGSFTFVKTLQEAPRSHGKVDMMKSEGPPVAVKIMPNWWLKGGPAEFKSAHPNEVEYPWRDMGLVMVLNNLKFEYVCDFHDVYRDGVSTYIVTSLATEGDLFAWGSTAPKPGGEREALLRGIMSQVCCAVKVLHDLGIAHRDLSLENILLTRGGGGGDDELEVKVIDFSMSAIAQHGTGCKCGKSSYKAPEMFKNSQYDLFLADAFALGVVLYATAWQRYPWKSTTPGKDEAFTHARKFGIASLDNVRNKDNKDLRNLYSGALHKLIEGLLTMEPGTRMHLGESCYVDGSSVWDHNWLLLESMYTPC